MVTVTQAAPTVTATVTVTPTANAQGEATQISADGVYVVGQDIPGGTWHTSGGPQCYEATLASTDTSNIIDNNNFTGPGHREPGGGRMRSRSAPQEYHGEAYGELAAPCAAFAPGRKARRNPLDDHGVIS